MLFYFISFYFIAFCFWKKQNQSNGDGGHRFFKIYLTIFYETYSLDLNKDQKKDKEIESEWEPEGTINAEVGSVWKTAKIISLHKVILLCVMPQIQESYNNIQLLVNLTKLNNIYFLFVSDFKLILPLNGL